MTGSILLLAAIGTVFLHASGLHIQDGSCTYRKWEEPGDVKFLLIGGVYKTEAGKCTTEISKDGFPLLLAFDWLIHVLNGNNSKSLPFIQGLKIGYDIYENCDNEAQTIDLLYSDQQMMNCSEQNNSQSKYFATISLTNPMATRTMSQLIPSLPVMRPLPSTAQLQDLPNLIQTVVSFHFEVQAIVDFMVHSKWNYIALIHDDSEDGKTMAAEFKHRAKDSNICVRFHYTLQTQINIAKESATNITKDLFTHISTAYELSIVIVYFGGQQAAYNAIEASKTQLRRGGSRLTWLFPSCIGNAMELKNAFLLDKDDEDLMISFNSPIETYSEIEEHYLSIVNRTMNSPIMDIVDAYQNMADSTQPRFANVGNVINATLAVSAALKGLWEYFCTTVKSCMSFLTDLEDKMLNYTLSDHNLTAVFDPVHLPQVYNGQSRVLKFKSDGTLSDGALDVKMFRPIDESEITLFTYTGDEIPDFSSTLPTSACSDQENCWVCHEAFDLRFSYLPGDYLILGLFSLRGYDTDAYRCDSLRRDSNDIISVSAFMYSILAKRNDTGMKFGGIAIDDCYSPFNTSYYLSGLFSKRIILHDPFTNLPIDFDKVFAIIGALSSSVSLVIGDVSTSLKLPMISYAASSPELDNRDRYPYFLRTVPSDILQVKGIIQLIKHLNITRVGLIYIDDSYGNSGLRDLQYEAELNHICIDSPLKVYQDMLDQDVEDVLTKLYEQQIGVVIYFSIDSIARRLLQKMYDRDPDRPLVFIASEAWGTSLDLVTAELGRESKGSLVFNIAALENNNTSYRRFLQSLTISNTGYNRWIPNFFEKYNSCDLIGSFEKYYSKICDDQARTNLDQTTLESLTQDQRGIHVMNAVHTITEGYKRLCPNSDPVQCSRPQPQLFVEEIRTVTINDKSVYTVEGNGDIGMTVYNIQRISADPYTFKYERIGSLSKNGKLDITISPVFYDQFRREVTSIDKVYGAMGIDTDCTKFENSCSSVCVRPTTASVGTSTALPVTQAPEKDDSLMRGLTIAFGALAGIMAVALVLLIVLLFRRHDAERHSSDGKYSTEATSVDAGNTSLYDEPGTIQYGRSQSESNIKDARSFLSLQENTPTQYAHIQPSPVLIHHKRHRSNQELFSHNQFLNERPASPMSAPLAQLHASPPVKHIVYKRSPRISHSPHSTSRGPELFKKRADASPKFRYRSKLATQENANLKVSSVDGSPMSGRHTLVSDDYERNSVFVDDSGIDPAYHHSDSYLYPQQSDTSDSVDKPKLTYLTAKDLVSEESEEEEDVNITDIPNETNKVPTQTGNNENTQNQTMQYGYDPSLISPSNNEIMAINFPESDKVEFSKQQKPMTMLQNSREATLLDSPMEKNKGQMATQVGARPNQPDIIPDIGPFESDEGIIII